jgi:hypothetical protein
MEEKMMDNIYATTLSCVSKNMKKKQKGMRIQGERGGWCAKVREGNTQQ